VGLGGVEAAAAQDQVLRPGRAGGRLGLAIDIRF